VKEGCFWYPTSYEFINLNFIGIICLKQKKALLYSVYTTASASNSETLTILLFTVAMDSELK